MQSKKTDAHTQDTTSGHARIDLSAIRSAAVTWGHRGGLLVGLLLVATTPAAAQTGAAFCNTAMAGTIQNLFTLIQFGGPLIGGVLALAATVMIPMSRRSDRKHELKSIRNQGLIYGVLIAPLGTAIVTFLLNSVVVGGSSCGF